MDTRTGKIYESMSEALLGSNIEDLIQVAKESLTETQLKNLSVDLSDDSELAELARNYKKAVGFNPLAGNREQRRARAKASKKYLSKR